MKLEQVLELLDQLVGPNGAYVLSCDDTREIQIRTKGREATVLGLNQISAQYIQDLMFSRFEKTLNGKDADLIRQSRG